MQAGMPTLSRGRARIRDTSSDGVDSRCARRPQWCRDMRALQEAAAAGASSPQPRAQERNAWVGKMVQRKGKLFDLDLPECIGRPVSIHSRARGGYRAPAALGHCPLRVVGLPRVLCSSPVRAAGVAREWGRASTRREQICSRRACRGPCPGP